MQGNYLTKPQREDFLIWYQGVLDARKLLADWTGNALTANEHKWLKTAVTMNEKVFASIINRLNTEQFKTLNNQISEIERRMKKAEQEDAMVLTRQDFMTVCEAAIVACCTPCACGRDSKCPWKSVFKMADMPFYDGKATGKGQCPYEHYTEKHLTRLIVPCRPGDKIYRPGLDKPCGYVESLHWDKKGWTMHIKGALEGWFGPEEIGRSLFLQPIKGGRE